MKNNKIPAFVIALLLLCTGCKKGWLEAKSDRSMVVPSTLADLQAILDNDIFMNGSQLNGGATAPALGETGSDGYYVLYDILRTRPEMERRAYVWESELYNNTAVLDWNFLYRCVFHANVVLDGLKKISVNAFNSGAWNTCQGSALFYRSMAFYNLVQTFAKQYDPSSAGSDPGIPLRLESSVAEKSVRASIAETYDQVINDLKAAADLLPQQPLSKTRPSRPAVNALLARIYLAMGDYTRALQFAEDCLGTYNTLIDYNTVNGSPAFPFSAFNDETIYYNRMVTYTILNSPRWKMDTILYTSYHTNDLRKTLYFKTETDGTRSFRGSYNGGAHFGGLATDEIYLIKAECLARLNRINEAMIALNTLLEKRWVTGLFVRYNASDMKTALDLILLERRKELILRGLRWTDLRRLNKDPQFAVTIRRIVNGIEYTLPPNDPRYVFAIPGEVIQLTGMQQNQR